MRSFPVVVVVAAAACFVGCPAAKVAGEGERDGDEGEPEPSCDADTDKPVLGAGAIFFGTREPSHVVLDPSQERAIVGIGTGRPPGSECSGTLITDDVVLTATHCTEGVGANNFYVTFGVDDFDPELVVDVVEKTEHPELDIAMLRLELAPSTQIDVTPIPAFGGTLRLSDAGEIFEQSGFGQTESGDSDGRLFVAEPFDSFEEPGGYLVVNGEDRHGVCFGDSGGPSLRQTADAGVRVMGALSYGDESCTGFDRYTRVDLVKDFIEEFAGPIPAGGPVACGDVDNAGGCSNDQRVAEFCDDGALVRDPCDADEICADVPGAAGVKRCIAVDDNPCGDVSAFGACDGNTLTWCDAPQGQGGVVRVRDCGDCGDEVCVLADNVTGFVCADNACGDLTFQGECDGDTARWCEDNAIQTQNCGDTGESCGFVDDETGFFCK